MVSHNCFFLFLSLISKFKFCRYLVDDCEEVDLTSASRLLEIEHLPTEDFSKWRKAGGTRGAIMKEDAGGKDGWWRMKYIPEFGRFETPSEEEVRLRPAGQCHQCLVSFLWLLIG